MDSAYFSAFAALTGSVIGGLTSLATSWLTEHTQAERPPGRPIYGHLTSAAVLAPSPPAAIHAASGG
jgi:hypothetical protein